MPRNFSELKSGGGTIPMLSPHPDKLGGGGDAIDARPYIPMFFYIFGPLHLH